MSKVGGQQYEPNQNHEDKVKPKREQQQGGGPKEHGVRLKATYGPGPLWELLGITIGAVFWFQKENQGTNVK